MRTTALVLPVQFFGDIRSNEYWWVYTTDAHGNSEKSAAFLSMEDAQRDFLRYMEKKLGLKQLSLLTQVF